MLEELRQAARTRSFSLGARAPAALLALAALALPAQRADADALGPPGSLISVKPIPGPAQFTRAWNVRYVSTGLDGKPIVVSGDVIAPAGSGKNRPVVAWAHPTSGIAADCAPSTRGPGFSWIKGLKEALARGYVVTATDYPGLGTDGIHPYLVGVSEARAVLDSVRAAHNLAATGAGTTFIPWGHSQGGHASLWTAQIAAAYAPDLTIAGSASAAPPTDIDGIVRYHVENNGNRILAAYTLKSWSIVYGAPLDTLFDPASIRKLDVVAKTCIQTKFDNSIALAGNILLGKNFLTARIYENAAWQKLFTLNSPALGPAGLPYFIAQGTDDTIVPPASTGRFAQRLCDANHAVVYDRLAGVGHFTSGEDSAAAAVAWMADRFAGKPARNDCASRAWL
jgi:alpha-beta hydrolase superfamily lysophospholipase